MKRLFGLAIVAMMMACGFAALAEVMYRHTGIETAQIVKRAHV